MLKYQVISVEGRVMITKREERKQQNRIMMKDCRFRDKGTDSNVLNLAKWIWKCTQIVW